MSSIISEEVSKETVAESNEMVVQANIASSISADGKLTSLSTMSPTEKYELCVRSLNNILIQMHSDPNLNFYQDIINYYTSKYSISIKNFENQVLKMLSYSNRTMWYNTIDRAHDGESGSRKAQYRTLCRKFFSSETKIKPFCRTAHSYQEAMSYCNLLRYDSHFVDDGPVRYVLSPNDPMINSDSGFFDFQVQLIINYDFINRLQNNDTCNSNEAASSNEYEGSRTLYFLRNDAISCISSPFRITQHDGYVFFKVCLSSNMDSYASFATSDIHAALRPLSSALPNSSPTIYKQIEFDEILTTKIPLNNPADLIVFYQTIQRFKGKLITLSPSAKLRYSQCLTKVYNTLTEAIILFKGEESIVNLRTVEIALTHFLVLPTFLRLFPSSKNRRLGNKNNSNDKLDLLLNERFETYVNCFKKQDDFLFIESKLLFNKNKSYDSIMGKVKTAEKLIRICKYPQATRVLNSIDQPELNAIDDATTASKLKRLTPTGCYVPEQEDSWMINPKPVKYISAEDDLKFTASNFAGLDNGNFAKINIQPQSIIDHYMKMALKKSAPGLDGITAESIFNLISNKDKDPIGFQLLTAMTNLFNELVNDCPQLIWDKLTVSSLIGIPKPDGGTRPIANGLHVRKAVSSTVLGIFNEQIIANSGSHQFAGKPLGSEKMATNARIWFQDLPDNSIFKFDIKNAFNSFLRSAAFSQLVIDIPVLGNFLVRMFNMPLTLLFKDQDIILSLLGSQQGCIFGSVLFNFAFKPVLAKLQELFPSSHINAYMDDNFTSLDRDTDILNFLHVFDYECRLIGLEINFLKSSCILPAHLNHLKADLIAFGFSSCNVMVRTDEPSVPIGMEVLGCPIGNDVFIIDYLDNLIGEYANTCKNVSRLQSNHSKWAIAHSSVFLKLIYCLRMTPCKFASKFYKSIEESDWAIIANIIRLDELNHLSPEIIADMKSKSKLKISNGGMGLKDIETLSKAAYLGSQLAIFESIHESLVPLGLNESNCSWLKELYAEIMPAMQIVIPALPSNRNSANSDSMHCQTANYVSDIKEAILNLTQSANNVLNERSPRKFQSLLYMKLFNIKFPGKPKVTTANNWLHIPPSIAQCDTAVYSRMMRQLFQFDFVRTDTKRQCICGHDLDPKELHIRGCSSCGIKQRHQNAGNLLGQFFTSIGMKPINGELVISNHKPLQLAIKDIQLLLGEKFPESNSVNLDVCSSNLMEIINATTAQNASNKSNTDMAEDISDACPQANNSNSNSSTSSSSDESNNIECLNQKINNNRSNVHASSTSSNSNSKVNVTRISNPLSAKTSSAGNRVDLLIEDISLFLDITIVNNALATDAEYLRKFESKHDDKNKLHLDKVRQLSCDYFAPVFSTDGSASPRTKSFFLKIYNKHLEKLEAEDRRLKIKNGSLLNHFFNLICFQINKDNAHQALLLTPKLFLSLKSQQLLNTELSDTERLSHIRVAQSTHNSSKQ